MARKAKWIQSVNLKKGALTRKAERAGQSPMAYARSHVGSPGTTGRQARLAITFSKMRHGRKHHRGDSR